MGYSTLKTALDAVVRTNGQQQITGANLNGVMTTLLQGVDILDRTNPVDTSGLNQVVLRKDKTLAEQVTGTNTIYEIRDNFTMSADLSIPAGCVIKFNGGKIDGGGHTLTFNRSIIAGDGKFANCEFAGSILNGEVKISWFTDGMSTTSDYSADHSSFLIAAMKLASLKSMGWLDLEKIPLCIKQTIEVTDLFGNIGIRGANIYFVSSADKQALFDYRQTAQYRGYYSPIIDSNFVDVGDHYNTCIIKKTSWSDTAFTYWRDIKASGFTGYFFVTNSYIQEVTFENISIDGMGMFSTNSNELYDGGVGSGNIINFLNCNINGGSSTSKTSIASLYDLSLCIEVTIHNAVCQGRIGGSDINVVNVDNTNATTTNRTTIELDGIWVEYVDGHVNGNVNINNSSCMVLLKRNSPRKIKVRTSNVTIDYQVAGGFYATAFWNGLDLDDTSNVTIKMDCAFYGGDFINPADYPVFKALLDSGRLQIVRTSVPPYGSGTTQTGLAIGLHPVDKLDLKKKYIETKMTGASVASKPYRHFLTSENGIPILNISHESGTTTYYEFTYMGGLGSIFHGGVATLPARSFYVEIIYRATILVDVTSENLSQVVCSGRGFLSPGGGAYADFITPEVGMSAGTTTGWIRKAFCQGWSISGLNSGQYMKLRNCKLEIAQFRMCRRNVVLDDEVFVDGSNNLQQINAHTEIFKMPIVSGSDNLATMAGIVQCENLVQTPKNVYRYMNGTLCEMVSEYRKSGTTAQRPTLSASDATFVYYDTTLSKPILWNGSAWVNTDGSALS